MFSINTNNNAMAALQSLAATNSALSETQNEVSTGKKVSSAADNPAVYAISQQMNGTIAGLAAVQDNLSFGAQVVATASSASSSISSTLATLQNTLTQGMSAALMNQNISQALTQINTFAASATLNGVNLISGAQGNGVSNTQLQVLTSTGGSSINVGGIGAQALNATASGLGIGGLSTTSTASSVAIGVDTSANGATAGQGLVISGAGETLTDGTTATGSTSLALSTANYLTGTATDVGQKWVFVLNDGSSNGNSAISNELNFATAAQATAASDTANGIAANSTNSGAGTQFSVSSSGAITLTAESTGGSITALGNGSTDYAYTTSDANGNPTEITHVVSVNISDIVAAPGNSIGGLNGAGSNVAGTAGTNTSAQVAERASVLGRLVSNINDAGFSGTIDSANNLTVVGNNLTGNGNAALANVTTSKPAGATAYTAGTALAGTTLTGAAGAIANITAAVQKLGTISATLGSATQEITGMQSFSSSLSDALTAGVGALTDADLASESAKLTSLQTKQQLAIQSLSIANQGPQSLLSLFK